VNSIGVKELSKAIEGECFYGVQLDNRVIKTLYKDDLLIPTKALAEAVAEEWDR
jgi:chaperone required for assembly of F1-ATPase